jgi:isoleucyl-tRNA synthetase
MKGNYVERRFGWDCHGLPIEYEIDKRDKITSSVQREEVNYLIFDIIEQITHIILLNRLELKNTIEDAEKSL